MGTKLALDGAFGIFDFWSVEADEPVGFPPSPDGVAVRDGDVSLRDRLGPNWAHKGDDESSNQKSHGATIA